MKLFTQLENIRIREGSAVALGYFDGVHLGHRAVLSAVCAQEGLTPAICSFSAASSSPPGKTGGRIYSDTQRVELFAACGIGTVLMPDFGVISGMSDGAYVDLLCGAVHAKEIFCGEDYRFSRGAGAGVDRLRALCAPYGARVHVVPFVEAEGARVSSTRIRALLRAGEVAAAGRLLGQPYFIDTCVESGQQLGRRLGFPTINQPLHEGAARVRRGVYAAVAHVFNKPYPAVTNVGVCPTVGERLSLRAETYILDFSGDLYGKHVKVELMGFLRGERRFDGLEALKERIAQDAVLARRVAEGLQKGRGETAPRI